jgi:molybdopterin/thiamine biosynthesis adenylyltransferase
MDKTGQLTRAIKEAASEGTDPAGGSYRLITRQDTARLAVEHETGTRIVELAALKAEIIPERYQRSVGTVGVDGQVKLLEARVGVLGAGGLGGFVIELLARMGVGRLVVVDGDTFADSNLNRQLLGLETNPGQPKVEAAVERITAVNSAVEVEAHHCLGDAENLPAIFAGCDLVIDCLDNLPSRFDLEAVCGRLGITMVHGAIAGFLGQIAVIRPDRPLLAAIYGDIYESGVKKGVEVKLGNPAATPAMLASWQASEAVKFLADLDGVLAPDKLLIIDMQAGESYQVEVGSEK